MRGCFLKRGMVLEGLIFIYGLDSLLNVSLLVKNPRQIEKDHISNLFTKGLKIWSRIKI